MRNIKYYSNLLFSDTDILLILRKEGREQHDTQGNFEI